jgi:zinc/manganese transport system substrate-binding protein
MFRGTPVWGVLVAAALLTGCSSSQATAPTVVATTTILGDITQQITACAGGTSVTLMPNGTDPHDFAASSQQIALMDDAELVVANGLGLEAGLTDALASASADGAHVLEVGPHLNPLPFNGSTTTPDPHVWFDMERMAAAAELIGSTLADTTAHSDYRECGQQVADRIRAADTQVSAVLESVPEGKRVLITDHDAFGYLAARYGYRIAGSVVPSSSTLAEPSSADLAALAAEVRRQGVPAIFSNVGQPGALASAVASEAGTHVTVVPLYVESLGAPGTSADSYIGMMMYDATAIADALNQTGDSP